MSNTASIDVYCSECGEKIEDSHDTVWFWDDKARELKTRHKQSCKKDKKGPDFYMKRVGQTKHD